MPEHEINETVFPFPCVDGQKPDTIWKEGLGETIMEKKGKGVEIQSFASDVGFGLCLGVVVDQFAGTSFIFTAIGTVLFEEE